MRLCDEYAFRSVVLFPLFPCAETCPPRRLERLTALKLLASQPSNLVEQDPLIEQRLERNALTYGRLYAARARAVGAVCLVLSRSLGLSLSFDIEKRGGVGKQRRTGSVEFKRAWFGAPLPETSRFGPRLSSR